MDFYQGVNQGDKVFLGFWFQDQSAWQEKWPVWNKVFADQSFLTFAARLASSRWNGQKVKCPVNALDAFIYDNGREAAHLHFLTDARQRKNLQVQLLPWYFFRSWMTMWFWTFDVRCTFCSWQPVWFWCKAAWQQHPPAAGSDAMSDMASEAEACHVWHGMPSSRPRCHHIIRPRPLLMLCLAWSARCALVSLGSLFYSVNSRICRRRRQRWDRRMDTILIWRSETKSPGCHSLTVAFNFSKNIIPKPCSRATIAVAELKKGEVRSCHTPVTRRNEYFPVTRQNWI